jgi:hypothetical protein
LRTLSVPVFSQARFDDGADGVCDVAVGKADGLDVAVRAEADKETVPLASGNALKTV